MNTITTRQADYIQGLLESRQVEAPMAAHIRQHLSGFSRTMASNVIDCLKRHPYKSGRVSVAQTPPIFQVTNTMAVMVHSPGRYSAEASDIGGFPVRFMFAGAVYTLKTTDTDNEGELRFKVYESGTQQFTIFND